MSNTWTADSNDVTADSDTFTASGFGGSGPPTSPQFPNVPAMPGVPPLARTQTAAQVAAQASVWGVNQALATALGLPPTTSFGTDALYAGLGLQPL